MIMLVAHWVLNALALYIVAHILTGVHLENFGSALLATLIISVFNVALKPILLLLTLPITILTLGLFTLVINAIVLLLASAFTPGLRIDGFGTALIASILLSLVSMILRSLVK